VVDHMNPNRFSDSAGVPWEGRSFESNDFSNDDGSASPELLFAIRQFRAGTKNIEAVIDEIRKSRLLIPLIAQLGDAEVGSNGLVVDKSAELSIVTVKSPDDQDSLVVFSSVSAMGIWNKTARPVPSDAVRVALAAASEMNTRVVLDPGSESEFVIRRPAIAAIAQNLKWLPPHKSETVGQVIRRSLETESAVVSFEMLAGDPNSTLSGPELRIELTLTAGLDPQDLREILDRATKKWSESDDFAKLVDSVEIKLRKAN
jgi:hypothetical protein